MYKIGDKVVFGRPNGEQTLGTVEKVNRTTLIIAQDEERGQTRIRQAGAKWKVPFSMVKPAGPNDFRVDQAAGYALIDAEIARQSARPKRPDQTIMSEIASCYNMLSPENLYADGERSPAQAAALRSGLKQRLRDLQRELGRGVSEDEAWASMRQRNPSSGAKQRARGTRTFASPDFPFILGAQHERMMQAMARQRGHVKKMQGRISKEKAGRNNREYIGEMKQDKADMVRSHRRGISSAGRDRPRLPNPAIYDPKFGVWFAVFIHPHYPTPDQLSLASMFRNSVKIAAKTFGKFTPKEITRLTVESYGFLNYFTTPSLAVQSDVLGFRELPLWQAGLRQGRTFIEASNALRASAGEKHWPV